MKRFWQNEDPAAGELVLVVDPEDGSQPQHFRGASKDEIFEKLADAQVHLSATLNQQKKIISGLRKPDKAAATAPVAKPRVLSADERFQIAQDITDPAKAPDAIAKVVEAQIGIAPGKLAEKLNREAVDEDAEAAVNEARIFRESTPEYYNSDANNRKLLNFLKREDLPITRNNLAYAFEQLRADGLLAERPAPPPSTTPAAPPGDSRVSYRERGETRSTGFREGDSSAAPGQRRSTPKYTRAQIEAMSTRDYQDKLENEPGFRELVDKMTA